MAIHHGRVPEPFEPIHHVYEGWDQKMCEVRLDDGDWVYADVRSWDSDEYGHMSVTVAYTRGAGRSTRLGRFTEERVRAVKGE